ncbi:palmitoyltransferase ZDHHC11 isoform X4 [Macaca fascicularis]|uniref:palmitoyltransferase ZDHHC11 isoform X4 n=1 Tax=Macaca fascicularis TaxID=9541 RepID=UPI0032B06AC4
MDTRSGSQCSVAPEAVLNNGDLVLPPRISRVNGWSLPLHYFQVVTWAVFLGLSSATFGIFIPLLPHVWKYIAYVVTGGIFFFHLVVHLIASCIDPADFNVRLMKNYSQPMPIFDRSKHAHVIQNQFCHLCKVTVNKKTKHCISCNKCVSGFDHHCKWINNCVGSRNYWFFFSTVASATAGMLCLITILLYILVQYFVDPGVLRTDPNYEDVKNTNTWLLFLPLFPVQVQTLIVVIIGMVVLLLDLLGLVQLGQLLIFHIYLKAKKLTTFEYLIKTRKEESSKHQAARKDPCTQMEEGFLQQGDGALGSSAQGDKAKNSLLTFKCLYHHSTPLPSDKSSSEQEADDEPSPSSLRAKVKSFLLIYKSPCHFCTSVNPDGDSSAKEADVVQSLSSLGVNARDSLQIYRRPSPFSSTVHPEGGSTAQEADDEPSLSSLGVNARDSLQIYRRPSPFCSTVHPEGGSTAQEADGVWSLSSLGVNARDSLQIYRRPSPFSSTVHPEGGSTARETDDAPSLSSLGPQQERRQPMKTDSAESEA